MSYLFRELDLQIIFPFSMIVIYEGVETIYHTFFAKKNAPIVSFQQVVWASTRPELGFLPFLGHSSFVGNYRLYDRLQHHDRHSCCHDRCRWVYSYTFGHFVKGKKGCGGFCCISVHLIYASPTKLGGVTWYIFLVRATIPGKVALFRHLSCIFPHKWYDKPFSQA